MSNILYIIADKAILGLLGTHDDETSREIKSMTSTDIRRGLADNSSLNNLREMAEDEGVPFAVDDAFVSSRLNILRNDVTSTKKDVTTHIRGPLIQRDPFAEEKKWLTVDELARVSEVRAEEIPSAEVATAWLGLVFEHKLSQVENIWEARQLASRLGVDVELGSEVDWSPED